MSEAARQFRAVFDPEKQSKLSTSIRACIPSEMQKNKSLHSHRLLSPSFHFAAIYIGIERALEELETVPKDAVQETMDSLFLRIHALEKSITDNIASLPPYDGRVCIEASRKERERGEREREREGKRQPFPHPTPTHSMGKRPSFFFSSSSSL